MKTFNVTYRTMTGRERVHTVEAEDHHGAHVVAVSDLGINFGDVVRAELVEPAMITVYAVEMNGRILALFRIKGDAATYARGYVGAVVHKWSVPAETFEFEGE